MASPANPKLATAAPRRRALAACTARVTRYDGAVVRATTWRPHLFFDFTSEEVPDENTPQQTVLHRL
ncbi:hypothetical protein ACSSS7_005934 [Eimeria intestinalis]